MMVISALFLLLGLLGSRQGLGVLVLCWTALFFLWSKSACRKPHPKPISFQPCVGVVV